LTCDNQGFFFPLKSCDIKNLAFFPPKKEKEKSKSSRIYTKKTSLWKIIPQFYFFKIVFYKFFPFSPQKFHKNSKKSKIHHVSKHIAQK
jgi:hypothetical protein